MSLTTANGSDNNKKTYLAGREVKKALLNIHGRYTEASTECLKKSKRIEDPLTKGECLEET